MDHFNSADDVSVELGQVFGWYPILDVNGAPNALRLVSLEKFGVDVKSGNVSRPGFLNVPVACDLYCVFFAENRIEDRLLGKPWRERAEIELLDKFQFLGSYRAKEGY